MFILVTVYKNDFQGDKFSTLVNLDLVFDISDQHGNSDVEIKGTYISLTNGKGMVVAESFQEIMSRVGAVDAVLGLPRQNTN